MERDSKNAFSISHSSETQRIKTKAGKKGFSTGWWTKLEHYVFIEGKLLISFSGLSIFGKNWKKVERLIPTRTLMQIRSHAQKFFIWIQDKKKVKDVVSYIVDTMREEKIIKEMNE